MTGTPSRRATPVQTLSTHQAPAPADLPPQWDAELQRLLCRQRDVCRRLDSCSTRQRQLLTADSGDQLIALLAERQKLIDQLLDVTSALEPYRQAWPDLWQSMPLSRQQLFSDLLDEVQGAVDRIITADQEDQETLIHAKVQVEQELNAVAAGRVAHQTYRLGLGSRPVVRGNRYVDHQG